jgi:hypothetical protein
LLALLAVLLASGTHWVALQAVAFGGMVVRYSQDAPLGQAIAKTFDGKHPCPLCHAVQKGRQDEEKRRPIQAPEARFEFCPLASAEVSNQPSFGQFQLPEITTGAWHRRATPPPRPPPRTV